MTTILTSLSEQELKSFLKEAIREVFTENSVLLKHPLLPDILDIKQAANFLKLKLTTLYEKTSKRIVPHFKKGNKLYFYREELERWITGGKVKTQQELEGDAVTYLMTSNK